MRNNVSIAVLGQMPSKQALNQQVQRMRQEVLKAPENPRHLRDLVIPHRFKVYQKRGKLF